MITKLRSRYRGWKRAAEQAIAPEHLAVEKDRLAAEIAKQIWVKSGGSQWTDASMEGSLLFLETLVSQQLPDEVLRVAAGMRYLDTLTETLRTADYEDARGLRAELHWSEGFLEGAVPSSFWQARSGSATQGSDSRLAGLRGVLTAQVLLSLRAAEIAA